MAKAIGNRQDWVGLDGALEALREELASARDRAAGMMCSSLLSR
jgi:hypothetical protein